MGGHPDLTEHLAKEDPRTLSPAVVQRVLERDHYTCQVGGRRCRLGGENVLQLHHVVFRSHGGGHLEENLVTVCFRCHNRIHAHEIDITLQWDGEEYHAFVTRRYRA